MQSPSIAITVAPLPPPPPADAPFLSYGNAILLSLGLQGSGSLGMTVQENLGPGYNTPSWTLYLSTDSEFNAPYQAVPVAITSSYYGQEWDNLSNVVPGSQLAPQQGTIAYCVLVDSMNQRRSSVWVLTFANEGVTQASPYSN